MARSPDLNEILGADSPEEYFAGREAESDPDIGEKVDEVAERVVAHIDHFQAVTDGWIEREDDPQMIRVFSRIRQDMEIDKFIVRLLATLAATYLEEQSSPKEGTDE